MKASGGDIGKVRASTGVEAHDRACLNCGQPLSGRFCSYCGQSAHTRRLSIPHFIEHDLVHSFWHVDRGIFMTLRDVVIRPGHSALAYIGGKRAGKFPIFTLLLLLIGLWLWLGGYSADTRVNPFPEHGVGNRVGHWFFEAVRHHAKWILLGQLPVSALASLVVFRKARLNYTEHLLLNSYIFAGLMIIQLLLKLITMAFPSTTDLILSNNVRVGLLFQAIGYWQAFHSAYRLPGMFWRIPAWLLLDLFLLLIVAAIAGLIVAAVIS